MMSFDGALRGLAGELDLPEPVRSRVLLELRSDLEAMGAALLEEGLPPEEARRRTLEALFPSSAALAELRAFHRPLYQRLVDRFSDPARHRLERGLLTVVAVVYLLGGMVVLSRFELLEDPSAFVWPLLVLGALVAAVGGAVLFRLFAAGVHESRLVPGPGALLGLGAVALVIGFGGSMVDLYGVAGRMEADGGAAELLGWLRRDAALLSLALLTATTAGLAWLGAAVRMARNRKAEAEALGLISPEGRTP